VAGYPARASYTRTLCTQILEYDVLLTGSVHHMTIVTLEQPGSEDPLQARPQPHRAPINASLPRPPAPALPFPPSLRVCLGLDGGRRGWSGRRGRRGCHSWVGCDEVGRGEVGRGRRLTLSSPPGRSYGMVGSDGSSRCLEACPRRKTARVRC
jgi:hypothetical protein